jgi:uncharacterized ion transporter superfamily protein YfcC
MGKRKFKVPHTLVILFTMVVLAQILTYVIPAGSFDRVETAEGRMQVVPGSFHLTPGTPMVSPFASLTAIPKGFSGAHEIIFFVFIIGGLFAVLRATGSLEAGMATLLRRWGGNPFWLVAGGLTLFAFGSCTVGFGEEYYPFVPVLVSLCLAMGYDRLTAIGIIMVGYGAGYGPAIINPFTTLIAQDIAGLEPASGLWYRLICFFIFVGIGIHHVWSYAKRVKQDPSASLVADIEVPAGAAIPSGQDATALSDLAPMTNVQRLIMAAVGAAMVLLIYGMIVWKWGLFEMQGLFAGLTLVIAFIARMSPDRTADQGGVVDTMVYGISVPIKELPSTVAAVGMFFVQSILNFFIPSGSGQAFVTMPIMAPLADVVGIFQFGDGFSNILIPTQYVLIGILAMAGIPYDRWLRYILPLMVKIAIVGSLALVVAVLIGYS